VIFDLQTMFCTQCVDMVMIYYYCKFQMLTSSLLFVFVFVFISLSIDYKVKDHMDIEIVRYLKSIQDHK